MLDPSQVVAEMGEMVRFAEEWPNLGNRHCQLT